MPTVLVTAPAGQRGTALVGALDRRGHDVRALRSAPAGRLAGVATVVPGNLTDADSVRAAVRGVDAVVLQLPVALPDPRVGEVVAAAAAEHGAQLLFLAHGPVSAAPDAPYTASVMTAVDRTVREVAGGTTVRVPLYLGNLAGPWTAPGVARGELAYPLPAQAQVAWTSAEDVAELVAALVGREGFGGSQVDAGGAALLDGTGLATAFGRALGRRVEYRALTPDEFVDRLRPVFGEEAAQQVSALYRSTDAGWAQDFLTVEGGKLAAELGVELTPVEEWVRTQRWS